MGDPLKTSATVKRRLESAGTEDSGDAPFKLPASPPKLTETRKRRKSTRNQKQDSSRVVIEEGRGHHRGRTEMNVEDEEAVAEQKRQKLSKEGDGGGRGGTRRAQEHDGIVKDEHDSEAVLVTSRTVGTDLTTKHEETGQHVSRGAERRRHPHQKGKSGVVSVKTIRKRIKERGLSQKHRSAHREMEEILFGHEVGLGGRSAW